MSEHWQGKKVVGTICCAEDERRNAHLQHQDAIFGFNHYVPDYRIAAALWDHAADWARAHNLTSLFGPLNLDYEDGYGILIEGYDRPPTLLCGHTPPYYREFIERYGFVPGVGVEPAFQAAAFRAESGTLSSPVLGKRGAYLLEVVEKVPFNESDYEQNRDK